MDLLARIVSPVWDPSADLFIFTWNLVLELIAMVLHLFKVCCTMVSLATLAHLAILAGQVFAVHWTITRDQRPRLRKKEQ